MTSTIPEKKKRRFFGSSKKEKEPSPTPINQNHSQSQGQNQTHSANPSVNPSLNQQPIQGNAPDSAYASSDGPSLKRNSSANIVPLENRLDGTNHDRNFTLNRNTGEVLDDDTGEVVTTTTTTTTTTTVLRNGKKGTTVEVSTQNDGQPAIAEAPGDAPPLSNISTVNSRSPAPPTSAAPSNNNVYPAPPPTDHGINFSSHAPPPPLNNPSGHPYSAPSAPPEQQPTPPTRNPNRKSRDYGEQAPVSPLRPNFSYPSRADARDEPLLAPAPTHPSALMPGQSGPGVHPAHRHDNGPSSKSTFENLKSAAVGLHGVGETLRGTINNEVDSRFPRSNAEKAERANMKNRSVLENGNREINRVSERWSQETSGVPPSYAPPPQGPPQSDGLQASRGPIMNEMSNVPPSFSPESNGYGEQQKKSGLFGRKLMKRRPVGGV